ncbi:allantoate deiminase [Bacillus sp. ISL-40]|uniref:allantoate deiminase n=1 Tax=unclassified Bacillus (in: firmicutes) TaxID=185979 RepID=UPI001BE71E9D|nr:MULTISPECIES: allantoate deiminase [unclassified Bacillus (in: firmicutes)]MBT2696150.1 allantoate deiminase [Bacillus sp. ISL-40]MBT2742997.1 allantoate deiminase [Bacillus sp. ISL-77]
MAIQVDKKFLEKGHVGVMIEWLASFGKTENEGVTRLLYSPSWLDAQLALKSKMDQSKLDTYFDSVGNLFGRLPGSESNGKTILTGSHIDTVVDGGKYDGAYGIIASFIAVLRLFQTYGYPKKTIEVVSLCEEEGSRFPLAFWGSRSVSGAYNLDRVKEVKDPEGIPFLEAMTQAGFDPEKYTPPVRDDVERFVEIHIEQGMILEKNQNQIGIVTHIVGQRRYSVQIKGESNHAGTTPMQYRKDAVSTAAHFISFLTEKAQVVDPQLVATVGRLNVKPNVPNVVAGEVEFSLDIRHHQEAVIDHYCDVIFAEFKRFAENLNMEVTISQWMDVKPVKMDGEMCMWASEIAEAKNYRYQEMISGAGHDAQVFGPVCATSLLFVPSHNGISHSPKEFTSLEELETGIELLTELLYKLAY